VAGEVGEEPATLALGECAYVALCVDVPGCHAGCDLGGIALGERTQELAHTQAPGGVVIALEYLGQAGASRSHRREDPGPRPPRLLAGGR
jgi:hypothetical protein